MLQLEGERLGVFPEKSPIHAGDFSYVNGTESSGTKFPGRRKRKGVSERELDAPRSSS